MKTRSNFNWLAVFLILLLVSGCGGSSGISSGLSSGGDSGGTGISNTFDSPAEMGVGDIMPIEFDGVDSVTVDFDGVDEGAAFILGVGSYNESGGGTAMQLSADAALPEPGAMVGDDLIDADLEASIADEYDADAIFQSWLRASESVLHESEEALMEPANASKALALKAAAVGSTETFRVLNSLTSTTSYVEVTGEVRYAGSAVVCYVDTSVPEANLSDADVQELCSEFDDIAAEEQDLLGDTSDMDGDDKLHVLMTKQVNRLGALGGGIITGYFYAGDLYERSGSNPVSNYREIIYTMVPDPSGTYGTAISNSFAMSNLLPAVLPHELQHAISYNQHVFVQGGAPEENWLNEGMSHLMEDMMGYNVENPSRYALYLASPSTYGLVTLASPNLMERGAAYLFLRYLYEQSSDGDALLRNLIQTNRTGVENVEAAYDGSSDFDEFSEFVSRWTVALAMTDRGISSDRRYTYQPRTINGVTGNYEGVCLDCDAHDNRGTVLSGVNLTRYLGNHVANVDAGTARYYEVTTIPHEMTLAGTDGGGNFGVLIRTQ